MLLTRLLLLVALAVHLLYAALPLPLLTTERSDALVPAVLAVAPLFALAWLASKYRHQPHRWAVVSLVVAAMQSLGATAAIVMHLRPTELPPALNLVVCLALWLPSTLFAWLAGRALLARPAEVLGTSPYQVNFPLRAVEKASANADSVVVTDRAVEIWLQRASSEPMELAPGQKRGRVPWKTLPLNDITAAAVRSAVPGEAPWAVLRHGPSQSVPAGEVAVVRFGGVDQVLPVEDPAKFAELIRARTGRVLPSRVDQPARVLGAHVAEVLPAPEPEGPKVHPTRGPDDPLPTGPGLAVRWLVAAPLALIGVAGLPLALLLSTGATAGFLAWIGVAVVAWLGNVRVPRVWGRVAFLPVPVTLMWLVVEKQWLFALALVLCPVLGRLAGAVFTNWRGTDLGASGVEVPFKLLTGERLHLQEDRLVLEPEGKGELPYALWLADVDLVQCGVRAAPEVGDWYAPGGHRRSVFDSTWLRIVAGPQQWLVPTRDLRLVAELVRARATTAAPAPPDDLDLAGWYRLRAWAVSKTDGGILKLGLRKNGIGWRLFAAAAAGSFAFLLVPMAPMRIPGLVAAVLAVAALADWARLRPGLRRAEHHSLPPGSPNWGEVRADHAPVLAYQPWV
ncbi:hypothetical protein ACFFQW_43860 [Umezawaea endophytica]|uniref:Uncharacterized protein n=1 Tax=Umezawaea endophytica TaxID=1654476 RepID=A0A9X3A674_9PSEU|nr:hypothetical protein [Umezawaea endophytica]MCS7483088.1 hypothetical protein [Umezawaea endophytica]